MIVKRCDGVSFNLVFRITKVRSNWRTVADERKFKNEL